MKRLLWVLALAAALAAQERPVALVGGRIFTGPGPGLRRGTVLLVGGKIQAVGEVSVLPPETQVVSCRGKVVLPGLVALSAFGVGLRQPGTERSFSGEDPCLALPARELLLAREAHRVLRAALRAAGLAPGARPALPGEGADLSQNLDPHDREVRFCLAAGITTTWLPGDVSLSRIGMLLGMPPVPPAGAAGVALRLGAERPAAWVRRAAPFRVLDGRALAGRKRRALLAELEAVARYRRAEARWRAARARGKRAPRPKRPKEAATWLPVFAGRQVLRVFADTEPEIRFALQLADRYGLPVLLEGAVEAWALAPLVARHAVGVILDPRRVVPRSPPGLGPYRHGSRFDAPALLARRGVRLAFLPPAPAVVTMGIGGRDLLTLLQDAAFAVRGGLSRAEALRALTVHPARFLGLSGRIGALVPGAEADVIVLSGDPFSPRTVVERTYVGGRLVYLRERDALFAAPSRGRDAAGGPPPGRER